MANRSVPCKFVIFGGTGDLTHRKLLPAFYNLYYRKMLPAEFSLTAVGRREKDSSLYRQEAYQSVRKYSRLKIDEEVWREFSEKIFYQRMDFREDKGYIALKERLRQLVGNQIYYLAVAPDYFGIIVNKLHQHQLLRIVPYVSRLVIEKPFGHDLNSARELNQTIRQYFPEENIFRIDHYLGKEMLQNILIIRFANLLFEPLWNNKYIDNVQIVSSEVDGVGYRGGYYDKAGALKDMVQNHMLQLLTLTAMEPPADLNAESIRNEKVKVLKALRIDDKKVADCVVKGQYTPGVIQGQPVPGYREEARVNPGSSTETFAALKLFINNWRWQGVPFYIKTGKRLARKSTAVIIEFKSQGLPAYLEREAGLSPNLLVIRIQPREGVFLQFNAKEPGTRQKIVPVQMDYCQNCQIEGNTPEAYERLLDDIIKGDQTLFTRWDEVEYSWKFIDQLAKENIGLAFYQAGSSGPREAEELIKESGRHWWEI